MTPSSTFAALVAVDEMAQLDTLAAPPRRPRGATAGGRSAVSCGPDDVAVVVAQLLGRDEMLGELAVEGHDLADERRDVAS